VKWRKSQRRFMRLTDEHRLTAILARRQFGKTFIFAGIALKKMMKRPGHTVIFGSAKLNLSREIVRKEASVIQDAIHQAIAEHASALQVADAQTGKIPDKLTVDDFADLFEAQRLEFRFYHSRTVYSRTKVVALRADTVGETGDLMADEIGFVKNWREVWEAIEPIASSNPEFRITLSTTPPPDDAHFSFEQLVWPMGTEFPINPEGNIYKSDHGVWVLRVSAFDAFADNVPVYDMDKGEPLAPAEHRKRSHDKDAWDRNYGTMFILGGTSACNALLLANAQQRGLTKGCRFFLVETDDDLLDACSWITANLSSKPVGVGIDPATTENETSNPTSVAVTEQDGKEFVAKAVLVWKTANDKVATWRIKSVFAAIAKRPIGGRAKRGSIDATNERYWANSIRAELHGEVPILLTVGSETVKKPGMEESMTLKQYMGKKVTDTLEDNCLTLPPDRYIKDDFRLVKKKKGSFDNELDADGKHGDTFDAVKQSIYALTESGGDTCSHAIAAGCGDFSGGMI